MEDDNNPVAAMDFSVALELIKDGYRLAREGWNKSGQYVQYAPGHSNVVVNDKVAEATNFKKDSVVRVRPYMLLCTADGSFVPWVPTVSDVLAEDWVMIVRDED